MEFDFRFALLKFGNDKDRLITFLKTHNLDYEEDIEYALLCESSSELIACACISKNIVKCIAIDKNYQGFNLSSKLLTIINEKMIELKQDYYFLFTKPSNKEIFLNLGLRLLVESDEVLMFISRFYYMQKYLDELKSTKVESNLVACIVMNLNPMSKGHLYLIEEALKQCEYLHIFIVSEDRSYFSFQTRFEIAKKELSNYKNIILHKSGDFIISQATFPTYFIKDKANVNSIFSKLDLKLFAEYIAPALGINKRFIGSEDLDKITKDYNIQMQNILPKYGIEVIEIPRKTQGNSVISASRIRKIIQEDKDYLNNKELQELCVQSTYEYLVKEKRC